MATDRLYLAEMPPSDRMVVELGQGARALGLGKLGLPLQAYVTTVFDVLKRMQQDGHPRDRRLALKKEFTSFQQLGVDPERTHSGLLLWNLDGGIGGSTPHQLVLVRTAFDQQEDAVAIRSFFRTTGAELIESARTNPEAKSLLENYVPLVSYPIAEIPVGTTDCNFDYRRKNPYLNSVHRDGAVLLRRTFR